MKTNPAHIAQDGWDAVDSPELTNEQLADMKPISHFPELQFLVKRGRLPIESPKQPINIRLGIDTS